MRKAARNLHCLSRVMGTGVVGVGQRPSGALSAAELAAERRLIEAARSEPRRFGELYERYFDRVYSFALARTRDRSAAEDVTSTTFRRAFQNLPSFEWKGVPLSAWLFRIAANAAVDVHQRARRQAQLDEAGERAEAWDSHAAEIEERVQLADLLKRLPKDQCQVVVMRFAQDRSIKEIAEALGRSEGAVKQLQFRAIQSLRTWMTQDHD